MSGHAIKLTNMSSGYGKTTVVRNINLELGIGKIVALVGPNGAGKSTLLRSISGFIRPKEGAVKMHGADITHWAPHRRFQHGLCLIPEGRGVFRNMTVRENLALQATSDTRSRGISGAGRETKPKSRCVERWTAADACGQCRIREEPELRSRRRAFTWPCATHRR